MSKLIVLQDNDVIVLLDGTRIEVNTSMDGTPCGWIITEAAQQSVQRTVAQPCEKHNMEFCSECFPVVVVDFNRR